MPNPNPAALKTITLNEQQLAILCSLVEDAYDQAVAMYDENDVASEMNLRQVEVLQKVLEAQVYNQGE